MKFKIRGGLGTLTFNVQPPFAANQCRLYNYQGLSSTSTRSTLIPSNSRCHEKTGHACDEDSNERTALQSDLQDWRLLCGT